MGSFGRTATSPPAAAPADPGAALQRRQLLLIWAAGLACAVILISGNVDVTPGRGLVFNEMLVRLLHGRFDISPATIGDEAIFHQGRTYAYFGIFCALLRLPLLLTGQIGLDVTKASMVAAAALSLGARLMAMNLALDRARALSRPLRLILLAAVAFGGESLQYLRPGIFQEVCSWGAALAAVFVLLAVRRVLGADREAARLYTGMALLAGLALLCRVSFGFGLYAALGLMLCAEAWRGRARLAAFRTLAPAALVLVLFAAAAMGVNAARWGRPLEFVPLREQLIQIQKQPERTWRLDRYGALSLQRLPLAFQYYFAPVWVLHDTKGEPLFQASEARLFDYIELPPSSPILSDPVICILAALGAWALTRRRERIPRPALAGGAAVGLALPGAVMLLAISLAFRYRMDFYPALDFTACLGAAALRPDAARQPTLRFLALGALGATVSLAGLMAYSFTPLDSALDLDMRKGWTQPMIDVTHGRNPYIGHLLPDGRRIGVPPALR